VSGRLRHIIVAYDVETVTAVGRRRLRKVAKVCEAHGVRVQNSVFECVLTVPQVVRFIDRLVQIIDPAADNLRIYHLGAEMATIDAFGRQDWISPRAPMVI
jgi:CRISPR-associated protein Cas2